MRGQLLQLLVQQAAGAGGNGFLRVGVEEADEEEGDVVLPRDSAKAAEVHDCDQVAVAILLVADLELLEVGHIMHVPTEYDGAEAKAAARYGEELLFGDEFPTKNAIDVDAGKLDGVVALEDLREIIDGNGLRWSHVGAKASGGSFRWRAFCSEEARSDKTT